VKRAGKRVVEELVIGTPRPHPFPDKRESPCRAVLISGSGATAGAS
jgi:hypothetical protein